MKLAVAALIALALITSTVKGADHVTVNNDQLQSIRPPESAAPSSTSPSSPAGSSTPPQVQTTSSTSEDIEISIWNEESDSDASLVVIDSPKDRAEYSTHSVTLTVHAAAPSWSYMIELSFLAD